MISLMHVFCTVSCLPTSSCLVKPVLHGIPVTVNSQPFGRQALFQLLCTAAEHLEDKLVIMEGKGLWHTSPE